MRGISNPKIEKPDGALVSATTDVDVDAAGATVVDAVEEGDVDVAEDVSVELAESEITLEVDVTETAVDVMEIDALPVVPIITIEEG